MAKKVNAIGPEEIRDEIEKVIVIFAKSNPDVPKGISLLAALKRKVEELIE